MRYLVNISFRNRGLFDASNFVSEKVKTLQEAQSYQYLIDETVERACIVDSFTGKVIEWWKGQHIK